MKYYSEQHEWVQLVGDDAVVGLSAYAAGQIGDISYVELPREGSDVIVDDKVSVVESQRKSYDIVSPVSGTVFAVNEILEDDPGLVNRDPERKGWIYKLENLDLEELDDLMSEEEYQKYVKSL